MHTIRKWLVAAAVCGAMGAPSAAQAATRTVDDATASVRRRRHEHPGRRRRRAPWRRIAARRPYGEDVDVERDYEAGPLTLKAMHARKAVLSGQVRLCSFGGTVNVRGFTITGTVDAGCVGGSQAAVEGTCSSAGRSRCSTGTR